MAISRIVFPSLYNCITRFSFSNLFKRISEDEKDYYEEYKPEKEETIEDWKNEVTTTEGEEATKQILAQQDGYPVESSPTQTLNDSEESSEEEEDNSSEEEQQQEEEKQEEPEQEEESNEDEESEEESEEEDNSDSESESDE